MMKFGIPSTKNVFLRMDVSAVSTRCAHLMHQSDDVDGLQEILLELNAASIYAFPSTLLAKADRTFLMASAKLGRLKCCKLFLSLDSASSVNMQNAQGYTALHYAAYGGHTEVAFLLMAAGAKVDIRNVHGETAYETAVSAKKLDLLRRFQASEYYAALVCGANNPQCDPFTEPQHEAADQQVRYARPNNRRDAAMYMLEITAIDAGADENLIGLSFHCLSSEQQRESTARPSKLSGATCPAFGSIGYYPSEDLYIGRARSNHVCIGDLSLSKQHAVISYIEDNGFLVYDIGSKHGTFINGERIVAPTVAQTATPAAVPAVVPADIESAANDSASDANSSKADPVPAVYSGPVPATEYLYEGMEVKFGRIHCKVVRKRQDSVLSSGFQPGSGTTIAAPSTVRKHHTAVEQRVRVLLNVPDEVKISTSGHADTSKSMSTTSAAAKSAGAKRKASDKSECAGHATQRVYEPSASAPTAPAPLEPELSYKGLELLQKYGWQGEALGKSGGTANAPIEVHKISDRAGLGSDAYHKAMHQQSNNIAPSHAHIAKYDSYSGNASQATPVIDDELDSEKTKAWKRMMLRFNEPR